MQVKSLCSNCSSETNHEVCAEKSESFREDYACDIKWQITKCCGCGEVSFRRVLIDLEAAYPTGGGDWDVPEEVSRYPNFIMDHQKIYKAHHLSDIVESIYSETLLALQEDALILSGLGLRGTIEAVCNDLEIAGRSLATRIGKLATAGFISKKDAERLHGIRFMGNDAAHEIKKPRRESITIALRIVEHLLLSVYILDKEAKGKLDSAIGDYAVFERLLDSKIGEYSTGDELPLAKFLGRDVRRVSESLPALQHELTLRIDTGTCSKLTIGKVGKYQGSRQELQHFVVK